MPSEWDTDELFEAQDDPAAAVPPSVAETMRQFVRALTTPESDLEQQVADEVRRWAATRQEQLAPPPVGVSASRCLAGSSMSNSRCSSPSWSGASSGLDAFVGASTAGTAATAADSAGAGVGGAGGHRSSSSEEGSSAAWRLCSFLRRAGWPMQHCASFRSGGGGAGAGSGWRFASGHEFLLLHPHHCRGSGAPAAAGQLGPSGGGGSSGSSSSGGDVDMGSSEEDELAAAAEPALVIDPEFSTQFNLAAPTPRYQVVLSLLPRVFVGSYDRLQRLVEWVCGEMQASFQSSGSGSMPPWRSLPTVLNKWRVGSGEADDVSDSLPPAPLDGAAQQQLPPPPPPPPPQQQQQQAAAFSAEQQQAMRSLLLHPASPPPPHLAQQEQQQPRTGSSSCSSMDVVPSGQLPRPRSLLTQELTELAAASKWQPLQPQQQGPAAAILSMMGQAGSGDSSGWSR